jgi:hypothetical protein
MQQTLDPKTKASVELGKLIEDKENNAQRKDFIVCKEDFFQCSNSYDPESACSFF